MLPHECWKGALGKVRLTVSPGDTVTLPDPYVIQLRQISRTALGTLPRPSSEIA